MNVAKQDIVSVLCNQSNEGLCQEKWMAELTTVASILSTLLDCDLTNPRKEQAPICLSAAFMWHARLSHIYKYPVWNKTCVRRTCLAHAMVYRRTNCAQKRTELQFGAQKCKSKIVRAGAHRTL